MDKIIVILVVYFCVGVVQDFILTLNWRYIAENRPFASAISAFLSSTVSLLVLYNILTAIKNDRSIFAIIAYTSGIGLGTYLALKSEKTMNHWHISKTKKVL